MHFATPSPVEWTWIAIALIGVLISIGNLAEALYDNRLAETLHNGRRSARLVITNGAVFRDAVRLFIFVTWLVVGVGFAFFDLPDIPRLSGLIGLIVTAIAHVIIAAQETRERRMLDGALIHLPTPAEQEMVESLERTAINTERIADATERHVAGQTEEGDPR